MTKYHINPETGRPNKCVAQPGNCKYRSEAGTEAPHYDTKEEARAGYEMEQRKKQLTFNTVKKKQKDARLAAAYNNLSSGNSPSKVELLEAGEIVSSVINERLSFDPYGAKQSELSREQLEELRDVTLEVLRETTDYDAPFTTKFTGNKKMLENVNSVAEFFPNGVKKLIRRPIHVVHTRKGQHQRSGQYSFGGGTKTSRMRNDFRDRELRDNVEYENGTILLNSFDYSEFREMMDGTNNGSRRLGKNVPMYIDGKLYSVWVGAKDERGNGLKPGGRVNARKLNVDNGVKLVSFEGEHLGTVLKSDSVVLFEMFRTVKDGHSDRMEIPAEIFNDDTRSVAVHEFTHAVQFNTGVAADVEMYNSVAANGSVRKDYNYCYNDAFPDNYMGDTGKYELFTVATESLLFPSANGNGIFYGNDRKESADVIRNWVIGRWLQLDKYGHSIQ